MGVTIVWLRRDLRLADNPALAAAAARGAVLPVYIWAPGEDSAWSPGAASRWWLHQSLTALADALAKAGSPLVVRAGGSADVLSELSRETGADAVYANRLFEPSALKRDESVLRTLRTQGLACRLFGGNLLFDPAAGEVATKAGTPFKVFTPFWKSCLRQPEPSEPISAVTTLGAPEGATDSLAVADLNLTSSVGWADGFMEHWSPGEQGAERELDRFLEEALQDYDQGRDRPDRNGTSRLSPHLHFGEMSVRSVWHAVRALSELETGAGWLRSADTYLRELGWREFSHHLLHHFPHTAQRSLRPEFESLPWVGGESDLAAWQKGQTGYPIVDAGMRQLWQTGWMHNRVRMIVASFLVKDLLHPWQTGARWFWDTLVDADLANNTMGWQWTAGCGADAAPFFRVFNPVLQGEKFDPDGDYVRTYVPELARVPLKWLHKPWAAEASVLTAAGITLGRDYPTPVVDHAAARDRALVAYDAIRQP